MTSRKGHLIGGPFDGGELPAASRNAFVWVNTVRVRAGKKRREELRGFVQRAPGRQLYRSVQVESGAERFLYAGNTYRRCSDCGTYVEYRPVVEGKVVPGPTTCLCGADVSNQAA